MSDIRASWVELLVPDPVPFGPGYPPGSVARTFPAFPELGPPIVCVRDEPGGTVVLTPLLYRWGLPAETLGSTTPPNSTPAFGTPVLLDTLRMLDAWRQKTRPFIPGLAAGPAMVNPGGGNLILPLLLPDEGPSVPAVALIYNSRTPNESEAGHGWSVCPKQTITSLTSTAVDLDCGDGTCLRYDELDGSGYYRGSGGTSDALQFDSGSQTWTRTAPDGSTVRFGPVGPDQVAHAESLQSPAGGRWTLGYDGGNRLTSAQDPFGYQVTLEYQSGLLRRIVQPSGRVTTFSIVGGDLVGVTRPDGTQVAMAYDGDHRLTSYTDPRGKTTLYRHESQTDPLILGKEGRLVGFTTPGNNRTTFAYLGDGTPDRKTLITDPTGALTTLQFDPDGNLATVTNPLGDETNYTWVAHRLSAYQDGLGNRSTLTYAAKADRTAGLESARDAAGGIYTFLYDSSGRVQGLVDQVGSRVTLSWSGGVRTGLTDQFGLPVGYASNPQGQVVAVTDQLGRRSTTAYDGRGSISP